MASSQRPDEPIEADVAQQQQQGTNPHSTQNTQTTQTTQTTPSAQSSGPPAPVAAAAASTTAPVAADSIPAATAPTAQTGAVPAMVPGPGLSVQASAAPEAQANEPPAPPIEVDTSETDSAYGGSDSESYSTSLLSSVRNYQFENGRTYHGYRQGTYLLPNDEEENERLDIFHHLMGIVNGGRLHRAPIISPQRVLDIGTGTGIWAIQMGDDYPSAEVLGIDLSPIQPTLVPPNVHFQIDDIEENWTFNRPFDLIHCRYMPACIADFPRLLRQAYEHTKPGGWIEFEDWDLNVYSDDGTLTTDHAFKRLHTLFQEACGVMGRVGSPGQHLKGWIEAAGFVNVTDTIIKLPFGTWPKDRGLKEIGAWNRLQIEQGLDAFAKAPLTRALGWSIEAVQVFLVDIRQDCGNRSIHSVYDYHVVTAQRPKNATAGAPVAATAEGAGPAT